MEAGRIKIPSYRLRVFGKPMQLSSLKTLFAMLATATLLSSCGGQGTSAAPPVGGLTLDPLEGGIQISWTAVPGVEYWLYYKTGTNICKNCDGSSDSWKGGTAIGLKNALISSPYYLPNLSNGTSYAFIMDARINGGPGGEATPSRTTASRLAGSSWTSASNLGSSNIKSVAFNGSTYLGLGTLGAKYQSTDGRTWTAITSTDTTNYLSATYAFSKFVGVGANGAGPSHRDQRPAA